MPPENCKGLDGHHTVEALKSKHQPRQRSAPSEVSAHTGPVKTSATTGGENLDQENLIATFTRHDRRLDRKKQKRRFAPIGSARSRQRLREVERVLSWHWGAILPDDDAGRDDLHILLSVVKAVGKTAEEARGFIRKLAPWMTAEAAKRANADASLKTAYLTADQMADQLGVTYAEHQSLHLRTIGATDVRRPERESRRRQRYDVKRKRAKAAKPPKPTLKPRENAIMKMVGPMIGLGELARKAARHRLFHHLENVPLEVRRLVSRLVKSGHLGRRLESRERGGKEWFLWREQAAGQPDKRDMSQMSQMSKTQETAAAQPLLENAPRKTPIFIGSNRGAKSCVNIGEAYTKISDLDGVDFGISELVAARERAGPRMS